jgi:hypothetical protein
MVLNKNYTLDQKETKALEHLTPLSFKEVIEYAMDGQAIPKKGGA